MGFYFTFLSIFVYFKNFITKQGRILAAVTHSTHSFDADSGDDETYMTEKNSTEK